MATIIFYEKPGCANNTRQKRLLMEAGHALVVHDLLQTRWEPEQLRAFFGQRPISEWFNRAAPRVKSGEIVPEALSESDALAVMLADPLLIRRPLMESGDRREAGFDPERISEWLSLAGPELNAHNPQDLERCARTRHCPAPVEAR